MQPHSASPVKSKMAMETSTSGELSSKKNHGKIPKRIHKAEREKMKREHLNESFLALANSLELSDQSNGKVCILIEATRTVKDMLSQIERLKKENTALLSEFHYVTVEKTELKDETSALEGEIDKLRIEINSKVSNLQLDLNMAPPECHDQELGFQNRDCPLVFPLVQHGLQGHIICHSHLAYPEIGTEQLASKHISIVSKPHARYCSPGDKWPFRVLEKRLELGEGGSSKL